MIAWKRLSLLVALLVFVALLAACGDTPTAVTTEDQGFLLALPRITVDVASDGQLSVAGLGPDAIYSLTFGQLDLRSQRFSSEWAQGFTNANLQHIEFMHKDDGVFMFVNGKLVPHLSWSGDSLARLGTVAAQTGLLDENGVKLITFVLPLIQRLGIDIAFKFPTQEGAQEIPMRDLSAPLPEMTGEEAPAMARLHLMLDFNQDGVPSVLGMSSRDLAQMGIGLQGLELTPSQISQMQAAGIQHLSVQTAAEGLLLWMNGEQLPSLAWSGEELTNAAELFSQLYGGDPRFDQTRVAVDLVLPLLNKIDGMIVLRFPVPDGVELIPLPSR